MSNIKPTQIPEVLVCGDMIPVMVDPLSEFGYRDLFPQQFAVAFWTFAIGALVLAVS